MNPSIPRPLALLAAVILLPASLSPGAEPAAGSIRHSYLVLGSKTAIIGEDGNPVWEYQGGTRDGFVLPDGNVLLAFSDRVEEVTRDKQVAHVRKGPVWLPSHAQV